MGTYVIEKQLKFKFILLLCDVWLDNVTVCKYILSFQRINIVSTSPLQSSKERYLLNLFCLLFCRIPTVTMSWQLSPRRTLMPTATAWW